MLKETTYNEQLLEKVFQCEKAICEESLFTISCSHEDSGLYSKLYNIDSIKFSVLPGGFDEKNIHFVSKKTRKRTKSIIGCSKKIALFIGSWHLPNIEAVYEIFKIASKTPQYHFIILGSVDSYFANKTRPSNVGFAGCVNEAEKLIFYKIADVALNPMISGSGINVKMIDYIASGIPVITTPFGNRGLNLPEGTVVISELEDFPNKITTKSYDNLDVTKGRQFVEKNYAWSNVGEKQWEILLEASKNY